MDHLRGSRRYHPRDHGNCRYVGAACRVRPPERLALPSWDCAGRSHARATEYADHRHRHSVAPSPLLRCANSGADCEPTAVIPGVALRFWSARTCPRFESGNMAPHSKNRHQRCRLQFVIWENVISSLARIIPRQMNSLRRKIDRLKCALRFLRRQTFLAPGHCPTQSGCEWAVDPNLQVEVIAIHRFKQEDSFQPDDVDVAKRVTTFAESRRGLL